MPSTIVMLLGRSVWTRNAAGWQRESFESGPGAAAAVARLSDILSNEDRGRQTLLFEPEGMAHQVVETPKVSRTVFASLERMRGEFPVVESESLGWGIESPEPAQGGAFTTIVHSELTPGLVHLRDACDRAGSRLVAAWPAYTAAVSCVQSSEAAARARILLILTPDFVAVAACTTGKRSFKGWTGQMSEREWKALSVLVGETEGRSSPSMADPALRRGGIAVVTAGDPRRLCPLWDDIHASGRVGAVMDLDALAAGVDRLPRSHPANLAEAFPVARDLDRCLVGALSASLAAALVLGMLLMAARRHLRSERAVIQTHEASLEDRLAALKRNQKEIDRLRGEAPADAGLTPISRHDALVELAAAVPDSLTLTSLVLSKDNGFVIEALVVSNGVDPESLRRAFERSGFNPDSHEGWILNAAAGRLSIHGRLGTPRT